ncbi:MAG: hypothetical protein IT423_19890, partial [Pirellulaceae bacterium]|nr:hypothetical protein [Pirellulaceae bacterium]
RGSALVKIDGGGGTQDLIEFRGDANVSFTYAFTRGQRLIAENAGRQEYAFRGIERATISGGPSANIIDARELIFPVTIYGSGGDDELFGSSSAPSTIFGDDGHDRIFGSRSPDTLRGGRGNDVIYGNDGDDLIYGEDGHDILVGGFGADMLYGGNGDDLLMGAYSPYFVGSTERAAREAIMAVWTSTINYTDKVTVLRETGVGVDNSAKLNWSTVFDDFAVDTFFGNAGTDWFLLNVFTELNLPLGGLRDKSPGELDTY